MNKIVDDTNTRREKSTLLDRFLRGSSDEISFAFIKDLHIAKDSESMLILKYCYRLLDKEVADLLNIDERTVRQRVTDAKYDMEIAVVGRFMNEFRVQIKQNPVTIPPVEALIESC